MGNGLNEPVAGYEKGFPVAYFDSLAATSLETPKNPQRISEDILPVFFSVFSLVLHKLSKCSRRNLLLPPC
jgi:hypothetical protein